MLLQASGVDFNFSKELLASGVDATSLSTGVFPESLSFDGVDILVLAVGNDFFGEPFSSVFLDSLVDSLKKSSIPCSSSIRSIGLMGLPDLY